MSPNDFFSPLEGQSLLIPGQREGLRGQCVQSVGLYVAALGISFPAYPQAYLYYKNGIPGYQQVGAGNPIKQGDLIIWRSDFPPSLGAGHIDVAAQDGTLASFVAWDSNWYPPLKLAKLTHIGNNNNYIAGYLRREEEMLNKDQVDSMAHAYLNDSIANNPGLNEYVGKPFGEVIAVFNGAPERAAYLKSIEDLKAGKHSVTIDGNEYVAK